MKFRFLRTVLTIVLMMCPLSAVARSHTQQSQPEPQISGQEQQEQPDQPVSTAESLLPPAAMRELYNGGLEIVAIWNRKATCEELLVVLVGILGFVVTAIQSLYPSDRDARSAESRAGANENNVTEGPVSVRTEPNMTNAVGTRIRWVTAVIGVTIGSLTVITNSCFETDFKTYNSMVRKATKELTEAKENLDVLTGPGDNAALDSTLRHDFFSNYHKVTLAAATLDNKAELEIPLVDSHVYAQTQTVSPGWIATNGSNDTANSYFVGSDIDANLETAKDTSLSNAYINGAQWLATQRHLNRGDLVLFGRLTELVKQLSTVSNNSVTYDSGSKTYTSYTRIAVPTDTKNLSLNFNATSETIAVAIPNDSAVTVPGTDMMLVLKHLKEPFPDIAELYLVVGHPDGLGPFMGDKAADERAIAKFSSLNLRCQSRLPVWSTVLQTGVSCVYLKRFSVRESHDKEKFLGIVPSGKYQLIGMGFQKGQVEVEFRPKP